MAKVKLETIEGIGPVYAVKLRAAGIRGVKSLLQIGATPKGRMTLAETTGIHAGHILDWVNRADLMRIDGVGEEYSDLLEVAGVDTIVELAQRNPGNLFEKMAEANTQKRLVRRMPTRDMVVRWVEQAKTLPRIVTY